MTSWVWQLPNWPLFDYDSASFTSHDRIFLQKAGEASAILKYIDPEDRNQFLIEILSDEGIKSAKIEGEYLERESLQSSIKKNFALKNDKKNTSLKEKGMADLICDVYNTYQSPLTHEMLCNWQKMLMIASKDIVIGHYRNHIEPMQIVSARYDKPTIYYEAPPSQNVYKEMTTFVQWFNQSNPNDSILVKAALVHLYFECIHPFEDGNGRIGRALVEKALSISLNHPTLIAVSRVIEKRKKEYYAALGTCNRSLNATKWITFFADVILQAQNESLKWIEFLVNKSKLMQQLKGKINKRQEKVLLKMFEQGIEGFTGGLSAENYLAITKSSRATVTRDLAELVVLGALRKTGELRYTRYWFNF